MTNDDANLIWLKYRRWSAAAGRLKKELGRWRTAAFGLGIAGAFLETLSTQVPSGSPQKACALAGALCLVVIPVLSQRKLRPENTRAWVRARSASEGIKSEIYAFLARAAPYDNPDSATPSLKVKADEIEASVDDLLLHQARVQPEQSEPPGPLTPDDYIEKRVRSQIDFYRPSAILHDSRAARLRRIEFMLAIAAAALAAAAGVFGDSLSVLGWSFVFGAWVAVLTTIGGAITAQIGANRYDFLVTTYLGTANRLEDLASSWPPAEGAGAPSPEWSKFVQECENAISTENQGWMAKWTKS